MPWISEPPTVDFLDPRPFFPDGTAGLLVEAATREVAAGRPVIVREICRQLSLTPGAPYSHFENSAHLESVVTYNGLLSMASEIAAQTPNEGNPRERLKIACRAYRNWALSNSFLFGFIFPTTARREVTPFDGHVTLASRTIAIPSIRALRDGWDGKQFDQPASGPPAEPFVIPGIVSLSADETRVANALWVTTHGAVVLELAIGIHDGWSPVDPMFDWLIDSHISAHLQPNRPMGN